MLFVGDGISQVKCFLRLPSFPLVCDVGGTLIAASSLQDFDAQVALFDLPPDGKFPTVDVSSAHWEFYAQGCYLSPFTRRQRWTKKEVIAMYNCSDTAKKLGKQYSEKSLSAKRFDRIFTDIVELIQAGSKIDG